VLLSAESIRSYKTVEWFGANKQTELPVLLETVHPDVIIGTETWLTKNTGNGEIFPAELGFDVIRRDREGDVHGGVLIASKSEYDHSFSSLYLAS
jgi:hypothetical protein